MAAIATEVMRMGSEIIQMQSAKERYRTEHRTDHRKETAPEEVRYQTTKMQKEQILRQLKDQGCRITKQRLTLLDIILEEGLLLLQGDLLQGIHEGSRHRDGNGLPHGEYAGTDRCDQQKEYVSHFL